MDAFAVVREAARRKLGMRHFDVSSSLPHPLIASVFSQCLESKLSLTFIMHRLGLTTTAFHHLKMQFTSSYAEVRYLLENQLTRRSQVCASIFSFKFLNWHVYIT